MRSGGHFRPLDAANEVGDIICRGCIGRGSLGRRNQAQMPVCWEMNRLMRVQEKRLGSCGRVTAARNHRINLLVAINN